jgi:hypothetical protein
MTPRVEGKEKNGAHKFPTINILGTYHYLCFFLKVLALILLNACTTSNGNDHIDASHDYLWDDSIQS